MSANWRQKIDPQDLPTASFDWGLIKWFVTPDAMPGANLTFGEVVLLPGLGHDRHNHPDAEEILSGLAEKEPAIQLLRAQARIQRGDGKTALAMLQPIREDAQRHRLP